MSTIDDLVLKISVVDDARRELRAINKDLNSFSAQYKKVVAEEGAASASAQKLEQKIRGLRVEREKLTKEMEVEQRASKKLRAELDAQDRAVKGVKASYTSLFSVPGLVGGAVFVGIAASVRRLVSSYAEAQAAQTQLEVALRKSPAAASVSIDAYRKLNEQQLLLTGADDDALAQAEAVLSRFHLTGQEITNLIPLVRDLAVAKGIDEVAASEALGKALLGSARILKNLGIDYKATGDRSADLATLQDALAESVGGLGAAYGIDAAGQLVIFDEQVSNLRESLGEGLTPLLAPATSAVNALTTAASETPAPVRTTVSVLVLLGSTAVSLAPAIAQVAIAMKLLKTQQDATAASSGGLRGSMSGLTALFNPYTAAIAIAAAGLLIWLNHMAAAKTRVAELADGIDAATGKLNSQGEAALNAKLLGEISAEDWKTLDQFGLGLNAAKEAIGGGEKAWGAFIDSVNKNSLALGQQGVNTKAVADNIYDWAIAADEARAQQELLTQSTREAAAANGNFGLSIEAIDDRLTNLDSFLERGSLRRNLKKSLTDLTKNRTYDSADAVLRIIRQQVAAETDPVKAARIAERGQRRFFAALKKSGATKGIIDYYTRGLSDSLKPIADSAEAGVAALKAAKSNPLADAQLTAEQRIAAAYQYTGQQAEDAANKIKLLNEQKAAWNPSNPYNSAGATSSILGITLGSGPTSGAVRPYTGGLITGPGTGTSDSIPAMISNGEFVTRAAATSAIGVNILQGLNQWDRLSATQRAPIVDKLAASLPPAPRVQAVHSHRKTTVVNRGGDIAVTAHIAQGVDFRAEMDAYQRMSAAAAERRP